MRPAGCHFGLIAACPKALIAKLSTILSTDWPKVTHKIEISPKIWGKRDRFMQYFGQIAAYSGYQLSLNQRIARFNDRAG